jgi:hypothetical protein
MKDPMKARSILALPAVAALVLMGASAASAATLSPSTIASGHVYKAGHCYAAGEFATCVASGTANRPVSIHLHVRAEPNQHVSGAWDSTCSKGLGAGSESGTFSGMTRLRHLIRMSYTHPDSCIVSADAQLSQSGNHIKVNITYRR